MKLDSLEEKIIYYLMLQSNPITIAKIADLCNVSVNSIRGRIPALNEKIRGENLEIVMKRSVGCTLQKLDVNTVRQGNSMQYNINRAQFLSNSQRYDFIIRRLLCSHSYVQVLELCDMLYYSYSELHRDIGKANEWLARFHLKIVTVRNKGLIIKGDEFNKRICIVFQHKRYRYMADAEPWFAANFFPPYDVSKFHAKISEALSPYPEYALSHLNFPKIMNMLYVIAARHDYEDQMVFPENNLNLIRSLHAYNIAHTILNSFPEIIHFTPTEKEIVSIAITLECYRSIRSIEDIRMNLCTPYITTHANNLIKLICEKIHIDNDCIPVEEIDSLICQLYTIWALITFNLPMDSELMFPLQQNDVFSNDLSVLFYRINKEKYDIEIPPRLIHYTSFFFRTFQQNLFLQAQKYKVLIYSIYGIEYARYISLNLSSFYKDAVREFIPVEEIPSLTSFHSEEYDIVMTDASVNDPIVKSIAANGTKCIWLPLVNRRRRVEELDQWLLDNQIQLLHQIIQGRIQHASLRNKNEVYQYFYDNLQDDLNISFEEFVSSLNKRESIAPFVRDNRVAFITMYDNNEKEDILSIVINKKTISWKDAKIQFFIFYNYSFRDQTTTKTMIRFLQNFLRQTPTELVTLVEKDNADVIGFVMNQQSNA